MSKSVIVRHTSHDALLLFSSLVCSPSESVLILAMKVTMNVLHKMSTVLRSLLGSPQSATGDSMLASIAWPEGLAEKSDEGKSHWIQQQLQHIQSYCESLLQTGTLTLRRLLILSLRVFLFFVFSCHCSS